mgnify:CR=1 FL=1
MAMINCPECGKEISDKAKKCVYCGKVFSEEENIQQGIRCSECGEILSNNNKICPKCGCPVDEETSEMDLKKPQQVEVTKIKVTANTKKMIIGIVAAIAICFLGLVGYKAYSNNKAEKNYQQIYNEYISNLRQVQILMISGGSDAEKMCNLTARVWSNAIYEKRDDETDMYTRPDGFFVSDFNDALQNLWDDSDIENTLAGIESNQDSVKAMMKKLQNPPEKLDKCYDTVSDLYESYKVLTDLAVNPTGNYTTFTSNKSNAVSDFMASYEKLDSQIPEKIEEK